MTNKKNRDNHSNLLSCLMTTVYFKILAFYSFVSFIRCGYAETTLSVDLAELLPEQGVIINGTNWWGSTGASLTAAGDINRDGFDDILLGASGANRVYLLYGSSLNGSVDLAFLSANQGIVIYKGEQEQTGYSVASAGDVDADGINDIIIGARYASPFNRTWAGRVYVIYGAYLDRSINLNLLNSSQGVIIDGAEPGDNTGSSVASAGDLDADGIPEIIIGADHASPFGWTHNGRAYVLYGAHLNGTIDLANMSNVQGMILNPQLSDDQMGFSVASTSDINNDGVPDYLLGSNEAINDHGRFYVVYGDILNNTVDVPIFASSLGEIFNGVSAHDKLGNSLASVGDVNGQLITDILVGAPGSTHNGRTKAGRAYLLYGESLNAVATLTSLTANQGVIVGGANAYDGTGYSVAAAGDINADNTPDFLVGAHLADPLGRSDAGCVYVLYGGTQNGTLDLATLTAKDGFIVNGATENDWAGYTVSSAGDINGDGIADILIGAENASPLGRTKAGVAYVLFGIPLHLLNDDFRTHERTSRIITSQMLLAQNQISASANVCYKLRAVSHGHFEWINFPGTNVTQFYQSNITSGTIHFIPDGSGNSPYLEFQLLDGAYISGSYQMTGKIDYEPTLTQVLPIRIEILGERISLTPGYLLLSDTDDSNDNLVYTIINTNHIQFEYTMNMGIKITRFTQQAIDRGDISLVHDGTNTTVGFNFTFSDGIFNSSLQTGRVILDLLPMVQNQNPELISNSLTVQEGERVIVTSANLQATDIESAASTLQFSILDVMHGQFERVSKPGIAITTFTQQDIYDGMIVFQHDGHENKPSYSVVVSDGDAQSNPTPAIINFNADVNDVPVLTLDEWVIEQGATLRLSHELIRATDEDNDASELYIQVQILTHSNFYRNNKVIPILRFSQTEINTGVITLVHDDSRDPPEIVLTVQDGQLTSQPQTVNIIFVPTFVESIVNIPGTAEEDRSMFVGLIVSSSFVCVAGALFASYLRYRKFLSKKSRLGDENCVPRVVYEKLNVQGAADFKSARGLAFVAQIKELVQCYTDSHGNPDCEISEFAEVLADAIKTTCELQPNRYKQTYLVLRDDEKTPTLQLQSDTIIAQTHRILSHKQQNKAVDVQESENFTALPVSEFRNNPSSNDIEQKSSSKRFSQRSPRSPRNDRVEEGRSKQQSPRSQRYDDNRRSKHLPHSQRYFDETQERRRSKRSSRMISTSTARSRSASTAKLHETALSTYPMM